jgi:hypothetical protein
MDIELIPAEPFAAPVVDSLSVRVLVDSAYDRFISDATHPVVRIEHVRHIPGHERSTFAGEWGLSLRPQSGSRGEDQERWDRYALTIAAVSHEAVTERLGSIGGDARN